MNAAATHDCGSLSCGCHPAEAVARIGGVALHHPGEPLTSEELRERAWSELLRQEAVRQGLMDDAAEGVAPPLTPPQQALVGDMLDAQVASPRPTDDETRRYYDNHASRFVDGARARLRHILFAVTPGVDVPRLAAHAERALLELSHQDCAATRFAELARELSNCPSGAEGGELGWVVPQEIAPELAAELFHQAGSQGTGLRPRLVHSRFGLHIMDVREREAGRQAAYEDVRERIASDLAQQSRARALHQYIRVLAGRSRVEGIDLEASASPLVQ
jgi:peptidyl-prolyl cis-trans isomerase C